MMTLTDRCTCMVDSCWRRGMCEFCINNHGGNRATVSCALSPEEYAARKKRWDANHDEPHYPTNTTLGILSKETLDVAKTAILALRDAQKTASGCTLELRKSKIADSFEPEAAASMVAQLQQLHADLRLLIEQAEAAVLMSETAKKVVPSSFF